MIIVQSQQALCSEPLFKNSDSHQPIANILLPRWQMKNGTKIFLKGTNFVIAEMIEHRFIKMILIAPDGTLHIATGHLLNEVP